MILGIQFSSMIEARSIAPAVELQKNSQLSLEIEVETELNTSLLAYTPPVHPQPRLVEFY